MELVFRLVFKTNNRRIKPAVAGSIPALSAFIIDNQSFTISVDKLTYINHI